MDFRVLVATTIASVLVGAADASAAERLCDASAENCRVPGPHTIRVQVREDCLAIDQIVLSPSTYLNAAPGPQKNDTTIVQ